MPCNFCSFLYFKYICLYIEKLNPMCVLELLCSIISGKYAQGNTLKVNGDWRLINKYFMLCHFDNYFVSDFIYTRRKLMINCGFVLLFCSCLEQKNDSVWDVPNYFLYFSYVVSRKLVQLILPFIQLSFKVMTMRDT